MALSKLKSIEPHATPDGDFPNVPGNVANPENPAVFDDLIAYAKSTGAELILASDPDADRIGCAAPVTMERQKAEGRRQNDGIPHSPFPISAFRLANALRQSNRRAAWRVLAATPSIRRPADTPIIT